MSASILISGVWLRAFDVEFLRREGCAVAHFIKYCSFPMTFIKPLVRFYTDALCTSAHRDVQFDTIIDILLVAKTSIYKNVWQYEPSHLDIAEHVVADSALDIMNERLSIDEILCVYELVDGDTRERDPRVRELTERCIHRYRTELESIRFPERGIYNIIMGYSFA
jgi:hypothetical protein